ncbi:hypothetical protein HDV00_012043 [Rhizophlyctis rosea]|nr:hypothetical protein HDV00_012043 [Rhizophlyctis rosea]
MSIENKHGKDAGTSPQRAKENVLPASNLSNTDTKPGDHTSIDEHSGTPNTTHVSVQTDPVVILSPHEPLYEAALKALQSLGFPITELLPSSAEVDSKKPLQLPAPSATPTPLPQPSTATPKSGKGARKQSATSTQDGRTQTTSIRSPTPEVPTKRKNSTSASRKRRASEVFAEDDEETPIDDKIVEVEVEDDAATHSDYDSPKKKTGKKKKAGAGRDTSGSPAPAARSSKAGSAKKSDTSKKSKKSMEKEPADTSTPTPALQSTSKGKEKVSALSSHKNWRTYSSGPQKKSGSTSFDPRIVADLASEYPDTYWDQFAGDDDDDDSMINSINDQHPLQLLEDATIQDNGHITGMILSPDGTMLVTFCNMGLAKIWDVETFELIHFLKDDKEDNLDEFYVGRFSPDMTRLAVAGKAKDPKRWSEEDEDNHILPCPIKIFDVITGEVITRLENHEEEILCIKAVTFKGDNYFVTTSQDGYINRWKMDESWSNLVEQTRMDDGVTCMAFTVSFLPQTGNKYFVAACDDNICVFDFEDAKLVQTFNGIYSTYCDCVKVVRCLEYPSPPSSWAEAFAGEDEDGDAEGMFAYLISRGVEELDAEDFTISTKPNSVTLHKLVYPKTAGGKFVLQSVKRFFHEEYRSNSWLIKITSNGRYIAAPTYDGAVCMFNMKSGRVSAILRDHQEIEIRDVVFHPTRKMFFSCGDDGTVKVYGRGTPRKGSADASLEGSSKGKEPVVEATSGDASLVNDGVAVDMDVDDEVVDI